MYLDFFWLWVWTLIGTESFVPLGNSKQQLQQRILLYVVRTSSEKSAIIAIFQTGDRWKQRIGRPPLKNPNGAAAGGSRRWHLQIWCWHRWSCTCRYHFLQFDTSAPTFNNVIIPSTPTLPTFPLQLFLDFLFSQSTFLVHFSSLFSIFFICLTQCIIYVRCLISGNDFTYWSVQIFKIHSWR